MKNTLPTNPAAKAISPTVLNRRVNGASLHDLASILDIVEYYARTRHKVLKVSAFVEFLRSVEEWKLLDLGHITAALRGCSSEQLNLVEELCYAMFDANRKEDFRHIADLGLLVEGLWEDGER